MKRIVGILAAGVLIISLCACGAKPKGEESAEPAGNAVSYGQNMSRSPGIEEYLEELDFLTEAEKKQLIEDEKEAGPFLDKAEELMREAGEKREKILSENPAVKEYNDLMMKNQDLWSKIWENETQEQTDMKDIREYIQASPALTEDEKKILLEAEDRLDALESEMKKANEEADKATEDLVTEARKYYEQADAVHEKSREIWDKIHGNEQDGGDFTGVDDSGDFGSVPAQAPTDGNAASAP
ncbi:MAG: hypothetical protein Q4A78_01535 [Peptostreptococcaceae bacterium]|nr:hypothetical protein [Peptostreptococcaceae bacterium]